MPARDPMGSAREEAERLVATALAAATMAARGLGRRGGGFQPGSALLDSILGTRHDYTVATGSAECCVCPVCRLIAGMRDPSPEFAERLATGAGDLAAGVASLLRALTPPAGTASSGDAPPSGAFGDDPRSGDEPAAAEEAPGGRRMTDADGDSVWRAATRAPRTPMARPPADPDADPWAAATAAPAAASSARPVAEPPARAEEAPAPAPGPVAMPAHPAARPAKKAVAKKAVAKKAVAKKAVAKAVPEKLGDDHDGAPGGGA